MNEFLGSKEPTELPEVIQGGMGVAISDWKLSRAVAIAGKKLGKKVLPVVSGTGLSALMADRLQNGDSDIALALRTFDKTFGLGIAERIIEKYPQKSSGEIYKLAPKPEVLITGDENKKTEMTELAVASAFVEIWLAKQGHYEPVGINLLEKIQLMHLPTLLGAMMAGVDYVAVGAGIPNQIPKVLDCFANGMPSSYLLSVEGAKENAIMTLDPKPFIGEGKLKRPKFFPIFSMHTLAQRYGSASDGFVFENWLAGGHNASPRDKEIAPDGQPLYGERDKLDFEVIKKVGKPFYLAGAYADGLKRAQDLSAVGIQVGVLFALCEESGMREDLKEKLRSKIASGTLDVYASPIVSPTGFPFNVPQLDGTLSQKDVYEERSRSCKYGFLVHPYQKSDGGVGFRCPAESVDVYIKKGGKVENAEGKVCLCEGLLSTAGHAQKEPSIITLGKDLGPIKKLVENKEGGKYSAEDVLQFIFSQQ